MTHRNHLLFCPDLGLGLTRHSEAIEALLDLGREAKMLGARIETARQDDRENSFPGDRVMLRVKPDRRRTTRPHGPYGERRRSHEAGHSSSISAVNE